MVHRAVRANATGRLQQGQEFPFQRESVAPLASKGRPPPQSDGLGAVLSAGNGTAPPQPTRDAPALPLSSSSDASAPIDPRSCKSTSLSATDAWCVNRCGVGNCPSESCRCDGILAPAQRLPPVGGAARSSSGKAAKVQGDAANETAAENLARANLEANKAATQGNTTPDAVAAALDRLRTFRRQSL